MEEKLKQEIQDLRSVQAECQQAEVQILRNLLKCKVYHQVAREGAAGPCVHRGTMKTTRAFFVGTWRERRKLFLSAG